VTSTGSLGVKAWRGTVALTVMCRAMQFSKET
jgi:hypothetical protein